MTEAYRWREACKDYFQMLKLSEQSAELNSIRLNSQFFSGVALAYWLSDLKLRNIMSRHDLSIDEPQATGCDHKWERFVIDNGEINETLKCTHCGEIIEFKNDQHCKHEFIRPRWSNPVTGITEFCKHCGVSR